MAARRAHNPKAVGSNPTPATKTPYNKPRTGFGPGLAAFPDIFVFLPILVAALALRLAIARALPLESDEAISGVMALRILQGERPLFFYGQTYMGTLEAYLAAPAVALAGASTFALRLVPIAFSLVFCAATCALGRRIAGPLAGAIAGLYVGVSPLFLTIWSVKARTGYVETLAFGGLLLLLLPGAARTDRPELWRPLALGLIAGLAFWTNVLVLPYILVAAAAIALRPDVPRWRVAALALPSFALGSLPFWLANLASGFATFRELAAANAGGPSSLLLIPARLGGVIALAGPVLLGFAQPDSNVERFAAARAAYPSAFAGGALVGALLLALAAGRLAIVARRGWPGLLVARDMPLLALGALVVLAFAVDKVASLHYGEPRYLLPLYSTAPLFAGMLARLANWPSSDSAAAGSGGRVSRRRRAPRIAAALIVVAFLAVNLRGNLAFDPRLATPVVGGQALPTSNAELIGGLLARGDTRIYADYWIAYPVAFESGERVLAGVIGEDLRRGYNRYVPYAIAVDAAPSPAYVFSGGSPEDRAFAEKLRGTPATYQRTEVGGYAVYDRIEPPQRLAE